MAGDNFQVSVAGDSYEQFSMAIDLIWNEQPYRKAYHYYINDEHVPSHSRIVLIWTEDVSIPHSRYKIQSLPYPLDKVAGKAFLWNWLQQARYPEQPDHDGDNEKGFYISNGDFWGHVDGRWDTILEVLTDWQMYGK